MLDLFNIPSARDVQIFYATGTINSGVAYQVWNKPRGASMAYIFALGSGGGGGGGAGAVGGVNRAGGGGGCGSSFNRAITSLIGLPEALHVLVPYGGAGGVGNGTSGNNSIVSVSARGGVSNDILVNSGFATSGGGGGGGASAGNGGTNGGTDAHTRGCRIASLTAAQPGSNGGAAGSPGVFVTIGGASTSNAKVCSGGAGGAGVTTVDQAGGGFTAVAGSFLSDIRPPDPVAGSNKGADGFTIWKPFFSFGGCGGSSSNTGVGGAGGKGGYGAGGGGGGGGTTGGRGGDGGDGLVIIISW